MGVWVPLQPEESATLTHANTVGVPLSCVQTCASLCYPVDPPWHVRSLSAVGQLVSWSVGQLVSWSVGQLVSWSVGQWVSWSVGQLIGRSVGQLVSCWSVGQLVCWSAVQWVGGSVGQWGSCWPVAWPFRLCSHPLTRFDGVIPRLRAVCLSLRLPPPPPGQDSFMLYMLSRSHGVGDLVHVGPRPFTGPTHIVSATYPHHSRCTPFPYCQCLPHPRSNGKFALCAISRPGSVSKNDIDRGGFCRLLPPPPPPSARATPPGPYVTACRAVRVQCGLWHSRRARGPGVTRNGVDHNELETFPDLVPDLEPTQNQAHSVPGNLLSADRACPQLA